jgi:POT family proton-dependent oligopeptide transporter
MNVNADKLSNNKKEVKWSRIPSGIKYILGNELCERFSYYGMQAILVVFMTEQLKISAQEAKFTYHIFVFSVYFLPLLGGYLADRWWGKYKTILYLSLVYCVGHLILALNESYTGLLWGLALIAIGSGGIKPCVAAHVGDQFDETNQSIREKVYAFFYFAVKFGTLFSTLITPYLLEKAGASWAFGVPGILMALATLIFWWGRHRFVTIPPNRSSTEVGFFKVVWAAWSARKLKKSDQSFLEGALGQYSLQEVKTAQTLWDIIKLFFVGSMFWALLYQRGASWVLQAKQMNLDFFGTQLLPAQIQALNPFFMMLLIPVCQWGIYPLAERLGYRWTLLRKMGWGMVMAGLAFIAMGILQTFLDQGVKLHVAWQAIPYFVITLGEVMFAVTGLEFTYGQSTKHTKSIIMSLWLLSMALGSLLTAIVVELNIFTGANEFFFFAILMLLVSVWFVWVARSYRPNQEG